MWRVDFYRDWRFAGRRGGLSPMGLGCEGDLRDVGGAVPYGFEV